MSVDYSAVITRGFLLHDVDDIPEDFYDEWVIDYNGWSGGPYIVGYTVKSVCEEGKPIELTCQMGDAKWDELLLEACRNAGIEPGPIKTYFGVRVS